MDAGILYCIQVLYSIQYYSILKDLVVVWVEQSVDVPVCLCQAAAAHACACIESRLAVGCRTVGLSGPCPWGCRWHTRELFWSCVCGIEPFIHPAANDLCSISMTLTSFTSSSTICSSVHPQQYCSYSPWHCA